MGVGLRTEEVGDTGGEQPAQQEGFGEGAAGSVLRLWDPSRRQTPPARGCSEEGVTRGLFSTSGRKERGEKWGAACRAEEKGLQAAMLSPRGQPLGQEEGGGMPSSSLLSGHLRCHPPAECRPWALD